MGKIISRAWRAALLNRKAFTEAFFDDDAAADGAIVVAAVGAITYLGTLARLGALDRFSLTDLLQILIASVASWLILAFATWITATRLFGSSRRPQTMIAMHGLAALPLVLELGGAIVGAVGLVWYLVVLVVATQEASDLDLRKSVVSVLVGFAAAVLVRALISVPFAVFSGLF
ncbi:MAG: YIP1 family protein [Actinobacteria bacterium]|nr:YIP1 family protein [Actinomycetota bacterium]MCI0677558.1 YIP1 family protein [Actinomycetota bacterium]